MNTIIDSNGNYTFTVGGYFAALELLKYLELFTEQDSLMKSEEDMLKLIQKANIIKRNNDYVRQYSIPANL